MPIASPGGSGGSRRRPPRVTVRERRAAQRAAALAAGSPAARQRRLLLVLGPVGAVLLVAAILIAVSVGENHPSASGQAGGGAAAAVVADATGVPAATLDAVGLGSEGGSPTVLTGPALRSHGLPRVLFVGAEWCPFCAAERWPIVVALSRFGTFAHLGETASAPNDTDPDTATFSFHGSTYTSSLISFTGREVFSNQVVNGAFASLDPLDPADQALFTSAGGGNFPFLDIGGRYLINNATYDPAVLQAKSHAQIAAALANPASPIARGIDGSANLIAAALCKITNGAPAPVCTSTGVLTAVKNLPDHG